MRGRDLLLNQLSPEGRVGENIAFELAFQPNDQSSYTYVDAERLFSVCRKIFLVFNVDTEFIFWTQTGHSFCRTAPASPGLLNNVFLAVTAEALEFYKYFGVKYQIFL